MTRIPPHPRSREAEAAYQQVAEYGAKKFLHGENYRSAQQIFERRPFHHFVSNLEAIYRTYYDGAKWIETLIMPVFLMRGSFKTAYSALSLY